MDKKRIFRALVCFVLICVFMINTSPIRIRVGATAVDPVSVGAAAILMWFIGTYMGVVFNPTTANLNSLWNTIQVDVPPAIYSYYDDEEAAVAAQDDWQRAMYNFDFSIYDDDDFDEPDDSDPGDSSEEVFDAEKSKWGFGFNKSNTIAIGAELGAFLVDYFANIAEQGGFEAFTGAEAPEGYAYYNGLLLPSFECPSHSHEYYFGYSSGDSIYMCCTYAPLSSTSGGFFVDSSDEKVYYHRSQFVDGEWKYLGLSYFQNGKSYDFNVTWTSFDLLSDTGDVVLSGMEPTSRATIFVEPDMYFGDYPDQIEDGSFDEDSVKMPVFDFSQLMESSAYAQEAVRSMYNQIYNGDMSYNDYVDQIQADNSIVDPGGNPTVDPSLPGPVDPSAPLPSPPPALGDYTLDLRDFFPFCIPFDIYALLSLLAAEPEAPKFEFDLWIPYADYNWHIVIDLSRWDNVAAALRTMELLLFIVGLGVATRNYYIRG